MIFSPSPSVCVVLWPPEQSLLYTFPSDPGRDPSVHKFASWSPDISPRVKQYNADLKPSLGTMAPPLPAQPMGIAQGTTCPVTAQPAQHRASGRRRPWMLGKPPRASAAASVNEAVTKAKAVPKVDLPAWELLSCFLHFGEKGQSDLL